MGEKLVMSNQFKEHIERCIELYGNPIDVDYKEPILRESHEQMRADLMMAVGMLIVFGAALPPGANP